METSSPENYLNFVKESWMERITLYKEEAQSYNAMKEKCTSKVFSKQRTTNSLFIAMCFLGIAGIIGITLWVFFSGFNTALFVWTLIPIAIVIGGVFGFNYNYNAMQSCILWMREPQPRNPCYDPDFPTALFPDSICSFPIKK